MKDVSQLKYLKIAVFAVGFIFAFGLYPLTEFWPSGWAWHAGQSVYLQMIIGIYFTLGIFLMMASKNPLAHRSIIWFAIWSSVVHGAIMAVQSFTLNQYGHLYGDVLALFLVAGLLAYLMPKDEAIN